MFKFYNPILLWGFVPLLLFWLWSARAAFLRKEAFWREQLWLFVGLGLCLLALTRPQWGKVDTSRVEGGADCYLAIDVSPSMLVEDVLPSRLEFSITFAERLLQSLPGVRAALFPFAGNGFLQVPLTRDHSVIEEFLPMLSPSMVTEWETDFNSSFETLLKKAEQSRALSSAEDAAVPTFVVVLSDGESHHPISSSLLETFRQKQIRIFAIPVGTKSGGAIRMDTGFGRQQPYLKDPAGKKVTSKVDLTHLTLLAQQTEGQLFSADLAEIKPLAQKILSRAKGSQTQTTLRVTQEYYPWLLALGLFSLLTYFSLGRWQYAIRSLLPFVVLFSYEALATQNWLKELEVTKDPQRRTLLFYNLGTEALEQKDVNKATEWLTEASDIASQPDVKKQVYYNLGNALLQKGDLEQAIESYQRAYDTVAPDKKLNQEANQRISDNLVLAQQILQSSQSQQGSGKGGDPSEPEDRKGSKSDYQAQHFSDSQKKKIYDLIAREEQQTWQRLQRGNRSPINPLGRPW